MEKCGACNQEFENTAAYLEHTCIKGFKPTDPRNLNVAFPLVQEKALERGKK